MMKKQRTIAFVMALLLLVSLFGEQVNADTNCELLTAENSDYERYNLETKEASYHLFPKSDFTDREYDYSPGYYPNGIAEPDDHSIDTRAIVGSDNRQRITPTTNGPYCNTVYIQATFSNGVKKGSGFVIGPNAVATAAHCLYDTVSGETASSILVVPAKDGTTHPYGSVTSTASDIVFCSSYKTNPVIKNDWAIVELNTAIGNQTGWLGLRWQSTSFNEAYVYNTGYPSPDTTSGQASNRYMFRGSGYVKSTDTYSFQGNWDASAGNSGGPVYLYSSDYGYVAIGILTAGSPGSTNGSAYPTAFSTATRFTQSMYNLFVSYR